MTTQAGTQVGQVLATVPDHGERRLGHGIEESLRIGVDEEPIGAVARFGAHLRRAQGRLGDTLQRRARLLVVAHVISIPVHRSGRARTAGGRLLLALILSYRDRRISEYTVIASPTDLDQL